jgi:hypothetical protein
MTAQEPTPFFSLHLSPPVMAVLVTAIQSHAQQVRTMQWHQCFAAK